MKWQDRISINPQVCHGSAILFAGEMADDQHLPIEQGAA